MLFLISNILIDIVESILDVQFQYVLNVLPSDPVQMAIADCILTALCEEVDKQVEDFPLVEEAFPNCKLFGELKTTVTWLIEKNVVYRPSPVTVSFDQRLYKFVYPCVKKTKIVMAQIAEGQAAVKQFTKK